MKTLQKFSDEYLEQCKKMKPRDIVQFLEDFRMLQQESTKTKLISIKIEENLLKLFRKKADLEGIKYQTQIKNLMRAWLSESIGKN